MFDLIPYFFFFILKEVSKQLSLIDALLSNFDEKIAPCKNNEKKKEETQMPDSTTNSEKNNTNPFNCGDDVLLANKDGKYYLGMLIKMYLPFPNGKPSMGGLSFH